MNFITFIKKMCAYGINIIIVGMAFMTINVMRVAREQLFANAIKCVGQQPKVVLGRWKLRHRCRAISRFAIENNTNRGIMIMDIGVGILKDNDHGDDTSI